MTCRCVNNEILSRTRHKLTHVRHSLRLFGSWLWRPIPFLGGSCTQPASPTPEPSIRCCVWGTVLLQILHMSHQTKVYASQFSFHTISAFPEISVAQSGRHVLSVRLSILVLTVSRYFDRNLCGCIYLLYRTREMPGTCVVTLLKTVPCICR